MKKVNIGLLAISLLLAGCRGKRVGAVCKDGWKSRAAGRGGI